MSLFSIRKKEKRLLYDLRLDLNLGSSHYITSAVLEEILLIGNTMNIELLKCDDSYSYFRILFKATYQEMQVLIVELRKKFPKFRVVKLERVYNI